MFQFLITDWHTRKQIAGFQHIFKRKWCTRKSILQLKCFKCNQRLSLGCANDILRTWNQHAYDHLWLCIQDKESKVKYLWKIINCVGITLNASVPARPLKVPVSPFEHHTCFNFFEHFVMYLCAPWCFIYFCLMYVQESRMKWGK
jgi:hypothetical protein